MVMCAPHPEDFQVNLPSPELMLCLVESQRWKQMFSGVDARGSEGLAEAAEIWALRLWWPSAHLLFHQTCSSCSGLLVHHRDRESLFLFLEERLVLDAGGFEAVPSTPRSAASNNLVRRELCN